ncbi:MAG: hypothetical protein HC888_19095 [Candidatus Competibacteraceae bacterium]|nr:hypothetical protein [Candidatus Competibacteraceae bacterium]
MPSMTPGSPLLVRLQFQARLLTGHYPVDIELGEWEDGDYKVRNLYDAIVRIEVRRPSKATGYLDLDYAITHSAFDPVEAEANGITLSQIAV